MGVWQTLLHTIYPPQCLLCGAVVAEDGALCAACWPDAPFIRGLVCDLCGAPLPGDDPGHPVHCDACLATARPWTKGRAALVYRDAGRNLILALKHGDRTDLAAPAAAWMAQAGAALLERDLLVAPIPMHRLRLIERRQNHAALLSAALARLKGLDHCPDLLRRTRATPMQKGRTTEARFVNLQDAIILPPRRRALVEGRTVLLVDDVMTSGATFAAAAEACHAGGARETRVLALARAVRAD